MSIDNKTQVPIESELSISDIDSNHKNCSYCNQPFFEELWCKNCDPYKIIEGWTSENPDVDKFIKDTMYSRKYGTWLEWVPFDRFTDIEQIGEGGFSKVYSATWVDGKANYIFEYGNWKKLDPKPIEVALKRLNGSHEISIEYLNELKIHWNIYLKENFSLKFYGMTKDPITKEFMMIIELANERSLKSFYLNKFNNILWDNKIRILGHLILGLNNLHKLGYFHKNLHSGNILVYYNYYNYGCFGIIMTELSSGIPPFHDRNLDLDLAADICNGLRPEFGKGTPEFYKELAYRCMNSNPRQRPKADELRKILIFWEHSISGEMFGYNGKEVESIFKEADKEIKNISTLHEKNPDAIYISQSFSFNNLSNPIEVNVNNNEDIFNEHNICSYCNKSIIEELWCNECDPHYIIEGWTSEIPEIDKFIKDTMHNARNYNYYFLEWIPFDRFVNIEQIEEEGVSKVYSAIWTDGKSEFKLINGSWTKSESKSMKVILKCLNESQNITECLNKLKFYWNLCKMDDTLKFYGVTKKPKTEEIMIVVKFTNVKSLRNILTNDFNKILWEDKIRLLRNLAFILRYLHELKYFYRDLRNGNILQNDNYSYFELFELANEQKSDDKIYGILPYISPEILNRKPYTLSSDIYSFGIIMTELSSGKPPFYDKNFNSSLASDICNGLRPEFGKGTPEIYKKLAYKCMNANSYERPTADELYQILNFWNDILNGKVLGYIGKEIKVTFDDANNEIPNISTSYEKNSEANYTCQVFMFNNLPKSVNSSIIISYFEETKNKENDHFKNKICSYCNKPFIEMILWCRECDPYCIIEGWTSGNLNIDKFIKDSIYNARKGPNIKFLEWVPFDRFINIEQIGEGGFSKVYSATWIDGKSKYERRGDGSWKKLETKSIKVALKKLNGSQNISVKYLNELKIHWDIYLNNNYLVFYGMTRDPKTNEFVMILEFASNGNLRNFLLRALNIMFWIHKIKLLYDLIVDLKNIHEFGYLHKDLHSGNILLNDYYYYYVSDFGLSGPANEQKSDNKIYGVLPYIAPEVLNREPYTTSSDIYSLGIIMIELSFGKPPFYNRKHNLNLALAICNGLRPEFGKGTPEIYKKLAYRCTNANPIERPSANELFSIIEFWYDSINSESMQEEENFGYKGKEVKAIFEAADKEIPNILTSYEKDPDAFYTSRELTFSNLSKPVNSSIISSYLQDETNEVACQDSQLADLDFKRFL
ncbi:kinase-like domain-containing protein [Rhizophagus clarus]|uniref:Kinase-like domain-containing protein n=1 Tax=Rhizophagus clarus TaxID=94130 RepID=A0A8H3KQB4_9GLOM|nr:kinase-like domain-containing protein [Rhizophagus clarus]